MATETATEKKPPIIGKNGKPLPFGGGRLGGFGRQKGTPNKTTRDVKDAVSRFINDPDYQDNLMRRICEGRADHMERYFWETLHGRPKVTLEVGQPNTAQRTLAETLAMTLTKEERMQMAALTRKALTGGEVIDVEAKVLPEVAETSKRKKK